jgi:hypothetical protein
MTRVRTRIRGDVQAPFADASKISAVTPSGSHFAAAIVSIAAALLVIASTGYGTVFAYTQGIHHGAALAVCAVAMALGLELAKPFAIEGMFSCLRNWAFGRALAMALLGFVAIAYSLTAELSLMAATRGDVAAERTKASDATKDDRAELVRLVAERAALTFTAATAETVAAARETVAAAERTRTAECGKRGPNCRAREGDEAVARTALGKATADKAATDWAAKLDTDAAVVRARLARASPVAGVADPGAAALQSWLRLFGLSVPAAMLSELLVLLGVIALEAGSALSIVLVRAVGGSHDAASSWTAPQHSGVDRQAPEPARSPVDRQTPAPAPNAPGPAKPCVGANSRSRHQPTRAVPDRVSTRRLGPATVATKADAKTAIVSTLRDHGGKLEGASVRGLAALIGAHKSNVHNALTALIGAGAVAKVGTALVLQA